MSFGLRRRRTSPQRVAPSRVRVPPVLPIARPNCCKSADDLSYRWQWGCNSSGFRKSLRFRLLQMMLLAAATTTICLGPFPIGPPPASPSCPHRIFDERAAHSVGYMAGALANSLLRHQDGDDQLVFRQRRGGYQRGREATSGTLTTPFWRDTATNSNRLALDRLDSARSPARVGKDVHPAASNGTARQHRDMFDGSVHRSWSDSREMLEKIGDDRGRLIDRNGRICADAPVDCGRRRSSNDMASTSNLHTMLED
jgi:hypothetical protein